MPPPQKKREPCAFARGFFMGALFRMYGLPKEKANPKGLAFQFGAQERTRTSTELPAST